MADNTIVDIYGRCVERALPLYHMIAKDWEVVQDVVKDRREPIRKSLEGNLLCGAKFKAHTGDLRSFLTANPAAIASFFTSKEIIARITDEAQDESFRKWSQSSQLLKSVLTAHNINAYKLLLSALDISHKTFTKEETVEYVLAYLQELPLENDALDLISRNQKAEAYCLLTIKAWRQAHGQMDTDTVNSLLDHVLRLFLAAPASKSLAELLRGVCELGRVPLTVDGALLVRFCEALAAHNAFAALSGEVELCTRVLEECKRSYDNDSLISAASVAVYTIGGEGMNGEGTDEFQSKVVNLIRSNATGEQDCNNLIDFPKLQQVDGFAQVGASCSSRNKLVDLFKLLTAIACARKEFSSLRSCLPLLSSLPGLFIVKVAVQLHREEIPAVTFSDVVTPALEALGGGEGNAAEEFFATLLFKEEVSEYLTALAKQFSAKVGTQNSLYVVRVAAQTRLYPDTTEDIGDLLQKVEKSNARVMVALHRLMVRNNFGSVAPVNWVKVYVASFSQGQLPPESWIKMQQELFGMVAQADKLGHASFWYDDRSRVNKIVRKNSALDVLSEYLKVVFTQGGANQRQRAVLDSTISGMSKSLTALAASNKKSGARARISVYCADSSVWEVCLVLAGEDKERLAAAAQHFDSHINGIVLDLFEDGKRYAKLLCVFLSRGKFRNVPSALLDGHEATVCKLVNVLNKKDTEGSTKDASVVADVGRAVRAYFPKGLDQAALLTIQERFLERGVLGSYVRCAIDSLENQSKESNEWRDRDTQDVIGITQGLRSLIFHPEGSPVVKGEVTKYISELAKLRGALNSMIPKADASQRGRIASAVQDIEKITLAQ